MQYLLDSSYLYALLDSSERRHEDVVASASTIQGRIFLPAVVLTEVGYLVRRGQGVSGVAKMLEIIAQSTFVLVEAEKGDLLRSAEIIRTYYDSDIDVVDAVLMAIAERMDIMSILTLDQRDFRIFRPNHCESFDLIP